MEFHSLFLDTPMDYDGTQLRELFPSSQGCEHGNAALIFTGGCKVGVEQLVDSEDARANSPIYSENMLHVIMEFFAIDLLAGVYLQRLFMVAVLEELWQRGLPARRSGDDIYVENRKLSVSIATASRVSTLIHVGLNISSRNTPVPTISLHDMQLDVRDFSRSIMGRFESEVRSCWKARCKVWGVS